MDCFGTYFTHAQTCDNVRVQSATQWTASVHTLHMLKTVITFVFKVLHNRLLRYIFYTCPNLWYRSCSKCYAMDCCGKYFTHAQTCNNVRVQSATQWTASVNTFHMLKPVITFVFKVLHNGLPRCIFYTSSNPVITFVFKVLHNRLLRCIFYTCDDVRFRSATHWTAWTLQKI